MAKAKNKKFVKSMLGLVVSITLLATIFSGCVEEGTTTTITIKGSSTVLPIAETCAEEFMNLYSNITVTVAGGGSSVGIKGVANGECDIGDASRAAKASDVEDIEGVEFSDLIDHVIAYDGIAVVVSPNIYETVKNLTMEQVYLIYTGNISNWNEVGGPDLEIYVNDRASTSGTRASFVELVENSTGYSLEDFEEYGDELAVDNVNQENANVVTAVSGSQQAIGYVGLGYVDEDTCPAIALNGVVPSVATVVDGIYPISRSLHMYTLGEATGAAAMFLDFVVSEAGQQIVEDEGFIPL